jgi:hypothetical protein
MPACPHCFDLIACEPLLLHRKKTLETFQVSIVVTGQRTHPSLAASYVYRAAFLSGPRALVTGPMSMSAIIQRLFFAATRRRQSEADVSGAALLSTGRPLPPAWSNADWQRDRRYVKSLERNARATVNQRALETWLFALLVSTCPTRFRRCETRDWVCAERLARTPWQRHLVREGSALRVRLNAARRADERKLAPYRQAGARRLRYASMSNDRLRLIRSYAAIARRILDLVQPLEAETFETTTAPCAGGMQRTPLRPGRRASPRSGSPAGRRVRTVSSSRRRRGGHGASSHVCGRPFSGVSPASLR